LDRRLGGTQSRSRLCEKEKNLLPLLGIEQMKCVDKHVSV
jgi:hypothetical protein